MQEPSPSSQCPTPTFASLMGQVIDAFAKATPTDSALVEGRSVGALHSEERTLVPWSRRQEAQL